MDTLGIESRTQYFAIKDPMLSATNGRQGKPPDLEQRLQQAWLQAQLSNPKSAEDSEQVDNSYGLPPPRRLKTDLTSTLENLWTSTQKPARPVKTPPTSDQTPSFSHSGRSSSVGTQSADVSHTSALSMCYDNKVESTAEAVFDDWLDKVQAIQPVPVGADFIDEDFFRGLDGLNDAFQELEHLLPSDPPPSSPALKDTPNEEIAVDDYLLDDPAYLEGEAPLPELLQENGGSHGENGAENGSLPSFASTAEPTPSLEKKSSSGRKRKAATSENNVDEVLLARDGSGVSELEQAEQGVENPMQLLMSIAQSVAAGDMARVHQQLSKLGQVASVYGSSTQRLSAYFLEGLVARISGSEVARHTAVPVEYYDPECGLHLMRAFEVLISASPYLTFGNVASNCAILDAFEGHDEVHIVDFGIGYGIQWPALIQALASRPGGPPKLRITGVDLWVPDGVSRAHCIIKTGKRLETIAKLWSVPFEYAALRSKLEAVQAQQINIRKGEVVAVNCALRLHNLLDETVTPSNPRSAVLRTIRALNPTVLTIVEQNTNQNSPFFLSRFYEALHYYTAMFESIESSMPKDSKERRLFEQQVLGRAIVNVVACEGKDRVERQEPLGQWQNRVRRAGFVPWPLSPCVTKTVQELLQTYKAGYGLEQEDAGSLTLNWKGKPLLSMSAWMCDSQ